MTNVISTRARDLIMVAVIVAISAMAYGDDAIRLTDGVPVTDLSGAATDEAYYSIVVPAGQGQLQVSISGGTGDCDLYVKRDALPTYGTYDYRPFLYGNNETVTVHNPASGTWYLMLRGRDPYSGVTLVASCEPAIPTPLTNGVPESDISGSDSTERLYCIDVPAGQNLLEVRTWDGTGDVDLCVKHGSAPSLFDFDGRSFGGSTEEKVIITSPAAGRWYIMLHASNHYHGVMLRAYYGSGPAPEPIVEDDVVKKDLSGALGSQTLYEFHVPSNLVGIGFQTYGGTGNCDMYIKQGAHPTTSDWDYAPISPGNSESVFIGGSDVTGPWYVLLVGTQAYSGVTLRVHYAHGDQPTPTPTPSPTEKVTRLIQDVPATDLAGKAGSAQFFSIEVPDGVETLKIMMSGGTGDADLYVRKGALPTTSQFDYRPYLTGSNEQVTITKSAAGLWYIMVRGYQAFSGVTLVATFDGGHDETLTLQNGVAVTGLAGSAASEKFFKIDVPADQTKLEIAMSGGLGDADLYVRIGAKPTTKEWDYRPYLLGSRETVTLDSPKAGTYYIMVRGYMPYTDVMLKATYGPGAEQIKALVNCVPVADLSGAQDSETFFKIDVPAGQDSLRIRISGGSGDADLYVKKGEKPTAKSWDYHPGLHGNDEAVQVQNPAATTWYVMVRGYQSYSGVTLEACYQGTYEGCDHCGGCDSCGCEDSCGCDGSGDCEDWVIIMYGK